MDPRSNRSEAEVRALVRAKVLMKALGELEPVPIDTEASWVSTQAQAWRKARALVKKLARVLAPVERMEAKVQAKIDMVAYGEILADPELMDIIHSINTHYRQELARDLWPTCHKYSWFIHIIAPITRLPPELLQQILLIIIDNANDSPLLLMRVSKLWYTIVTGIWAPLKLGTTTPKNAITKKLERNPRLLDVLVDTEIDRGHFTPSEGAFQAIFAAIEAVSRWRTFVVETFPAQADLPEHLVNRGFQRCSNPVMSRLRTFKIKCPCEMSPLLERLLRILVTTASEDLAAVEINSPSVVSFLAPTYPSIFHSVKVLSLDTPGLPNPVDLLPHLHQLETLAASHLSFPIYHNDVNIPCVHTLRHLKLRAVSIQWMSGRTFHILDTCTILHPLHHHSPHTFNAALPKCKRLTFQGYPLDILHGVSANKLAHLSVMSSCPYKPRGSRQLVRFSSQALRESRLTPRSLHIGVEAMSWAWTEAFAFMSTLEELVIENAQPSSLRVKAFQSLVVHPANANDLDTADTPGRRNTPVCPSLKRFGLRYRRWLRPSEHFDLIPEFLSIIWSRKLSKFSLESFRIWSWSDQKDPLELIDGSQISFEEVERLANDDTIKGDNLEFIISGLWRIWV
jgi:hypothetical protein